MINWSTIIALILSVGGVLVIIVGIGVFAKAGRAKAKEVANTGLNLAAGFIIVALGLSLTGVGAWQVFGKGLMETVGLNTGG